MTTDQLLLAAVVLMVVTAAAIGIARRLNLGAIAALPVAGMALGAHSPLHLLTFHVAEPQALGDIDSLRQPIRNQSITVRSRLSAVLRATLAPCSTRRESQSCAKARLHR